MKTSTNVEFDFGTFIGFNFKNQSPIPRHLSTEEVLDWDHDLQGEAEFSPSGDNDFIYEIFRGTREVFAGQLGLLSDLLSEMGGDTRENYVKIIAALNSSSLADLSASDIEDRNVHFFYGTSFLDLRKEAAYELFELYYPDEYAMWEKSRCDGLIFDPDAFIDSPSLSDMEITLGDCKFLVIEPN